MHRGTDLALLLTPEGMTRTPPAYRRHSRRGAQLPVDARQATTNPPVWQYWDKPPKRTASTTSPAVTSDHVRGLDGGRNRGGAALALLVALALTLGACGNSKPHAAGPTTSATPSTPSQSSTTADSPVGHDLWSTYVAAVNLYDQLIADPRGLSTDPRLRNYMTGQWYSEVAQQINVLRLKNEVVKGPDRVYGFTLLNVTGDTGSFYACDTNDQNPYNAQTGAPVPNATPGTVTEDLQVTEVKAPSGGWLVEQVAGHRGNACAS